MLQPRLHFQAHILLPPTV
uniref:Uncharacterized protein n=1 Tax=Anguilla anguilla TaxID=7936 RepID=A0A0E9VZC8_ANGAN